MAYRVVRSRQAVHDLGLIFDHLIDSYTALGDTLKSAVERASDRLRSRNDEIEALAKAPFQGTLRPDLRPGLRTVTKNSAVFYFVVDEGAQEVRVLAVFFGGQDHQRHMLARLLNTK